MTRLLASRVRSGFCLRAVLLLHVLVWPDVAFPSDTDGGITRLSEILPDAQWPERRAEIERRWLELLGDFPTEVPELRPEMREVERKDGLTRYHVSFQAEPDDRVTAWLLVPDAARERPVPAIVCVHSTTWGSGKDQVIGLSGRRPVDPPRDPQVGADYGRTLARHGFVSLSIDLLTDGERIDPLHRVMDTRPFYQKHPDWSIVGKNTWDIMRSVDFLQTLDLRRSRSDRLYRLVARRAHGHLCGGVRRTDRRHRQQRRCPRLVAARGCLVPRAAGWRLASVATWDRRADEQQTIGGAIRLQTDQQRAVRLHQELPSVHR